MGIVTSSGEAADARYVNNGLRPYRFSSLGIAPSHDRVQADFTPKFSRAVQILRHKVGFDLPVTSAYRSIAYNNKVYQSRGQRPTKNSRHTHGDAIDIAMDALTPAQRKQVLSAALDSGFTSVGFYAGSNMVHLDARENGTSWGSAPDWAQPVLQEKWQRGMRAYQRDYLKDFDGITTAAAETKQHSSFLTLGDKDILIRTVIGEAAGEGDRGMEAVAHVIKNRTGDSRWPNTAAAVAKQPMQFSAWNAQSNGGNRLPHQVAPHDPLYKQAEAVVNRVFDGQSVDPTDGAVYYFAPQGMPGGQAPDWWQNAVNERGGSTAIGAHRFAGRSRGDQIGQGTSAANPSRGAAPRTMQVAVTERVDPSKWTMDQHEMYRKTGVLPTVTRTEERKVPGSEVEAQYRNSTKPAPAQTPANTTPSDRAPVASSQVGYDWSERQHTDAISSYLAQQLAGDQAAVNEAVSFALGNTGRNSLTPIDPIAAILGE